MQSNLNDNREIFDNNAPEKIVFTKILKGKLSLKFSIIGIWKFLGILETCRGKSTASAFS